MRENLRVDDFPNELIVDASHVDLVISMLRSLAESPRPPLWHGGREDGPELDLVLLKYLELAEYAPRARALYTNEIAALELKGGTCSDLDVLLHDLRTRFAEQHGFVPKMGKNRAAVIGNPHFKAVAMPVETTEKFELRPSQDGHGISVGVVDTPLAPHSLLPADFVTREREADIDGFGLQPWVGHSTFVAGLIRYQAPGAHLNVLAGLREDTGTQGAWETARKIASFAFSRIDINILNLSLGCVTADNRPPMVIERALEKVGPSVLVVASAGNRGQDPDVTHVWPAAVDSVVAVGAEKTMEDGMDLADFSVRQPWVDCTAKGVRVVSSYPAGAVITKGADNHTGVAEWKGTSFATATVSGAVAAMMTTHDDLSAHDAFKKVLELGIAGIRPYDGSR